MNPKNKQQADTNI